MAKKMDHKSETVLLEDQVIEIIKQKLKSRKWWLMLACSSQSLQLITKIEDRYYKQYQGKGKSGFIMGPFAGYGIGGIFMAHKSCMSPEQLSAVMGFDIGDGSSDVILAADTPAGTSTPRER